MCPIIVWPGRTASPSTCQSRTSDSQARGLGEAAVHPDRLDEPGQLGGRGDVRAEDPAGSQRARRRRRGTPRARACPGSTRSHRSPEAGSSSARSPSAERPGRVTLPVTGPEELGHVAARDLGELLATLVRRHPAAGPDRAQQAAGQRAGAGARLDDVGAGEDVGQRDDLGRVLRVDTAAPRGMETTNSESSGRNTRYSPPADEVTVNPSSRPISSSCSRWPLLEKNRLPGSRQKLWRRPLPSRSRTHSPARSGPRWTPDHSGASVACVSHPGTVPPGSSVSRGPPGRRGRRRPW